MYFLAFLDHKHKLINRIFYLKIIFTLHIQYHVRFGALEEVFMSYRPHGAWRTMEVLEELA
jgi:hypothetical protein